ncbi:MAG TPA: TRAP transporter small permease subunit [Polyangiaceae bacterium]|nr:TRAP transporter small permease subunit [Polyangiaceae bacterium]
MPAEGKGKQAVGSDDSGKDAAEPTPPSQDPPPAKVAAWGRPLIRLDNAWTAWEGWLCAAVLLLEVLVLSLWVGLKGLSTPPDAGNAGIVFRALTGSLVLGLGGFLVVRKKPKKVQRAVSITGVVIGIVSAKYWQTTGVEWSSNLLNWYQQASTLTLFGGLRGVGTRLTLLLALLGGSLATASGKHITIDLVTRFVQPKVRLPLVIVGWLGSAVICGSAAWGFFDHIAIEDFGAKSDITASAKVSKVMDGLGENTFIARKQIVLDMKTLPKVLKGERYSEWLGGQEWNDFLETGGFVERYGKEKIEDLKLTGDAKRSPIVVVPDRGEPRGELIKAANLVFPIGLLIIAIRFVLLSLLAAAGHKSVDPDAHVEGDDIEKQRSFDGPSEPEATEASDKKASPKDASASTDAEKKPPDKSKDPDDDDDDEADVAAKDDSDKDDDKKDVVAKDDSDKDDSDKDDEDDDKKDVVAKDDSDKDDDKKDVVADSDKDDSDKDDDKKGVVAKGADDKAEEKADAADGDQPSAGETEAVASKDKDAADGKSSDPATPKDKGGDDESKGKKS